MEACPLSRWSADSRWLRTYRHQLLATNPPCWICGHPTTLADTLDHVIPASVAPDLRYDPANLRPAHGVHGCPLCPPNPSSDRRRAGQPRRCNQQRGNNLQLPQQTRRSRAW